MSINDGNSSDYNCCYNTLVHITFLQKLKEQYDCEKEWQYKILSQFSFAQGSNQIKINLESNNWEAKADIENLNEDKVHMFKLTIVFL